MDLPFQMFCARGQKTLVANTSLAKRNFPLHCSPPVLYIESDNILLL